VFVFLAPAAPAQSLLEQQRGRTLVGGDLAVLEAHDQRDDLPCQLVPAKPVLGFDLRFHSGFDISVPLREIAGNENLLTILVRGTSQDQQAEPVYFLQKIRVPAIDADAKGDANLQGFFDLGEGKYKVDWLMKDRTERVCAHFWDTEAELPAKDKALALNLQRGAVAATEKEEFLDEAPVTRDATDTMLSVKVLINFAPQNANAASLQPADTSALVSILRTLQRDPHIVRFSVVAFNLQQQKVLYRQEATDRIDFPAIGEALKALQLGRVQVEQLQKKNSDVEFLGGLIQSEFKVDEAAQRPDALIIAGPKVMLQNNVSSDTLREVGETEFPVFYMNYNLYPQLTPWRDSIGYAVRYFKGQEYTISRPRDLWFAVTEMVTRIVKSKAARRPTSDASIRGSHAVSAQ
ncbi:MAG: acetyltransferase, partial [Acidobacteria bacterium]|nr:acetyltransferase [Acidobacteriota bacterium]